MYARLCTHFSEICALSACMYPCMDTTMFCRRKGKAARIEHGPEKGGETISQTISLTNQEALYLFSLYCANSLHIHSLSNNSVSLPLLLTGWLKGQVAGHSALRIKVVSPWATMRGAQPSWSANSQWLIYIYIYKYIYIIYIYSNSRI